MEAYSQLKQILRERKLTVTELCRRIEQHGMKVNLKSLYRLSHDYQPLERLDLRVAGAICEVCQVPLSQLIRFETGAVGLVHLPSDMQKRLDTLMARNSDGKLTEPERAELRVLVTQAESVTLANARRLAAQRQQLAVGKGVGD